MTLIDQVKAVIFKQFDGESTGHDWHHINRVVNLAKHIQSQEGGNPLIIELSALLHDISDHKFNGGKADEGGKVAYALLIKLGCNQKDAEKVKYIVDNVSYKGANTKVEMNSLEGRIVQDADRLDAIGAIGIARTFAYGGNKNHVIYDPDLKSEMHNSFEQYMESETSTINHFYEKLLLLKDRLNTKTAKEIGLHRHQYMEQFLDAFYDEWNFNSQQKKHD
ncbi:MAG: HD domain-containing protein [Crocinitomicaceae bacterium]|nr:HD domain-containing protein [Crocinitomicaceae bacterium]MDG1777565.1 HD domain-containing protein [Crocinitomicaceae bacterium]